MSRFIFIGAHPDDADIQFSATALRLVRNGHKVKFVSVCNGDCGHQSMAPHELAARRYLETQKAAGLIGIEEYEVLCHRDCEYEVTLQNRLEMIRIIRRFKPDVVVTHALNDYHVDHRNCGQVAQDAAYLLTVPHFCPDVEVPDRTPVFCTHFNRFNYPKPFRADAAVEFDSVFEEKLNILACHASQMFEWLPWDEGFKAEVERGLTEEEKRDSLLRRVMRFKNPGVLGRQEALEYIYGAKAKDIVYAECFEQTEYGKVLPLNEFRKLFV
jgi:LmbE family N-acetylglucosaminyl deacetylase